MKIIEMASMKIIDMIFVITQNEPLAGQRLDILEEANDRPDE
jgi:hypothetical protein